MNDSEAPDTPWWLFGTPKSDHDVRWPIKDHDDLQIPTTNTKEPTP